VLRVYNRYGRRDNIHKARIKILVKSLGPDVFRAQVEEEWDKGKAFGPSLDAQLVERMRAAFDPPPYESLPDIDVTASADAAFKAWYRYNTVEHKVPGYRAVFVCLKEHGVAPGDATSDQMDAVADLADRYSFGSVRATHNQNLLLADVRQNQLHELWLALREQRLATPNIGTLTDMIVCPGLDFCSLANAGTINVAKQIQERFNDFEELYDLGDIEIKMSGCMNACGHHHVGHIGILGVDKHGEEWYQITLGGSVNGHTALGKVIGPSVRQDEVADTIDRILDVYREHRAAGERFVDTVARLGISPFRERAYASDTAAA
jgi:sulfite reductase (NADPH) hemoprotein beta-component